MRSERDLMTPGVAPQTTSGLRRRRSTFLLLVLATIAAAMTLMTAALGHDGLDALDVVLALLFALTLPWTVVGFWNALIGLLLMRTHRDPVSAIFASDRDRPRLLTARTAILSCIRNEDTARVVRHLDRMIRGLRQSGSGDLFEVFVLSDSTWAGHIRAEEAGVRRLRERWGQAMRVHYRRRSDNSGYKAGNIQDFMARWGDGFDLALVLDADSYMAPETILRMVGIMQRHPRIGILQSLIVGLPTTSGFARVFQFGMRLGMRSYALGSAWWQGDCGPYWGHNAIVRVAPFHAHCRLDALPARAPLGGPILSHDQVEAVLMRRAGYEVRVLPEEGGSWEENPPTLVEFIRRDLRWCQGNLQYLHLLGMPGLHPLGRVQLALAVLMFVGSPAWVLFMMLTAVQIGRAPDGGALFDPLFGWSLFALIMTMVLAPKLATLAHLLLSEQGRAGFGGGARLLPGALGEILFSALLAPVMALSHSLFMGGLLFGKAIVWSPQRRDNHGVTLAEAWRRLWPHTLLGAGALAWLTSLGAGGAVFLSPFVLGLLLAVPIALVSAWPALGGWLARVGAWRIPEEADPPPAIRTLGLSALAPRPAPIRVGEPAAVDAAFGD